MALNEGLTWGEVGAIRTNDPKYSTRTILVRDAFRGGLAEKVLLPPGTRLYKFNDFATLTRADEAAAVRDGPLSSAGAAFYASVLSPWWSPYDPYQWDPGWFQRKAIAKHLGVSIREWGRVTSAIKENWNACAYLLVIQLRLPVYAFFGGFAQMARRDLLQGSKVKPGEGIGLTANLPGGATQFYIPNLRPGHLSKNWAESLLGE